MDIKKIFGQNVKKARKKQGFSQEKFAELLGIGIPALSKIECGKSYPTVQTIEKIVDILNLPLPVLYVSNEEINVNEAYKDIKLRLEKLKKDKTLFKIAYDFIVTLSD